MATPTFSLESVLSNLKIKALNEMQQATIDAATFPNDILLLSATGSGKTLAFLIPILKTIQPEINKTQSLIIVPSRELALQIEQVFKKMGTNFKITCCYGGHKREIEENNLVQAPAVIVGTPGRLADHIRRGNITVDTITNLVLDEFDKSLELGFQEEMKFIVQSLPNLQKRILTSATSAIEIPPFIKLQDTVTLNFITEDAENNSLAIKMIKSDGKDKLETLLQLICMLGNRSTIIFCNHRESVERTSNWLKEKDIVNVFYHGAMEQQERDVALCKFRNGTSNILVTTDLAARGLDIANIRYIIHYQLPTTEDIFTHRNGRTARMDASGTAIVILNLEEKLPSFIVDPEEIILPEKLELPEKPQWTTLFLGAGKKDKVNKIDIVGFLSNRGHLKKEDIGLIDVKDFFSFVAIKKIKVGEVLQNIKEYKIKNKQAKFTVAK